MLVFAKTARCFKKWRHISALKKQKNKKKRKSSIIFSFVWGILYWLLESPCFEFFGDGKYSLFEQKGWWKYDIYWLLKSSCFELFGNGKCGLVWVKKLMERWYLLGILEVSMIFQDLRNMVFRAVRIIY